VAAALSIASCSAGPGERPHDAGRKLAALVAADASGLAVAPLSAPLPADVHVVALAVREGEAAVLPTRESLLARRYPLGRALRALGSEAPVQLARLRSLLR